MKECEINCSASISSNCLHQATLFDGREPGPEHLQKSGGEMINVVAYSILVVAYLASLVK
jgi:hypothetical protein